MEESSNAMAHQHHQKQQQQQQQQQQILLQHHQQQQQLLLFQQLQQQQQQQQQQAAAAAQAQAAAISRFPSNIDAHLRPPGSGIHRPPFHLQNQPQQNPTPQQQQQLFQQQQQQPQQNQQQMQAQQKAAGPSRGANNQLELEMAHQDAWRICHPDIKRPFASLEDACERLLPYHVVADYEAEEDDKILDSDTTGQMPSRSQQWDHTIAAKVSEFTATFEKQVMAFNIITRRRAQGEFRSEERLMIEQALLQSEKKAMLELRAEIESREKAGREAKMRMAMAQAEQARAEAQPHFEMMARGPLRANAVGSHGEDVAGHNVAPQEQGVNMDEILHGWGSSQREDEDPSEDFLNDENDHENGKVGIQDEWKEDGELDLNNR